MPPKRKRIAPIRRGKSTVWDVHFEIKQGQVKDLPDEVDDYLGWMQTGEYPLKLKLLYFFEWLPIPWRIKLIYAHLYYVLARVPAR